jgi:nitrate reductase gamma subunit
MFIVEWWRPSLESKVLETSPSPSLQVCPYVLILFFMIELICVVSRCGTVWWSGSESCKTRASEEIGEKCFQVTSLCVVLLFDVGYC